MSAKHPKGLVEMPNYKAGEKFGTRKATVTRAIAASGRTESVTYTHLGVSKLGDSEVGEKWGGSFGDGHTPAKLPLETDEGHTVYVLRPAFFGNGNRKKGKGGIPKWEVVSETVEGAIHVDAVSQTLIDQGFQFTHTIIWKTEEGTTFTTPLESPLELAVREHLGEYANLLGPTRSQSTEYVFSSPEDVKAFIQSVERKPGNPKASLGIWAGMRDQFETAVLPAEDDSVPEAGPEHVPML